MAKWQMAVAVVAVVACCSNVEARGRRMAYQSYYPQYTYATPMQTTTVAPAVVVPQSTATQTVAAPATTGIVQMSGTAGGEVVSANAVTTTAPSTTTSSSTITSAAPAAVGSAQWKAEQCARMGSVQHLGGGFGGGSYEGCGFGATPEQAIQTACFWGQRQPIEIGVARGANGYYSTIFYR